MKKNGGELKEGDTLSKNPEIKIGKVTTKDDKTTYEFIFPEGATKDFSLTYYTKAPNRPNATYHNKLEGEGAVSGDGIGVKVPTGSVDFVKSNAQNTKLDKNTLKGSADWTITANQKHYEIDGWFFEDNLSQSGFQDKAKTAHYFSDEDFSKIKVTEIKADGTRTVLPAGSYKIEKKLSSDGKITGFKIYSNNLTIAENGTFTNAGGYSTTSAYEVSYSSTYEVESGNYHSNVGNTANFTYLLGNNPHNLTSGHKNFNPQVDDRKDVQGSKSGTYDPNTNKITWKITLNNQKIQLGQNGTLVDLLPAEVVYNHDLVIKKDGVQVYPANNTKYHEALNGRYLTITGFEPGNAQYEVSYSTSPKDADKLPIGSVTNTAKYEDTDVKSKEFTAKVSYTNATGYLTKSGNTTNDKNIFHYTLEVNKDSLNLKNVVVEDTAKVLNGNKESGTVKLLKDSLKVYEVNSDGTPTSTPIHYVASFQEDAPQLTLYLSDQAIKTDEFGNVDATSLGVFSKHIKIEYNGKVTPKGYPNEQLVVANSAEITGENIHEGIPDSTVKIPIKVDTAGGEASGVKGSLTITKTDLDGNKLDKASFNLYRGDPKDNDVVARNKETVNGSVSFTGLTSGIYSLVEVKAPEGYVLSKDVHTFEIGKKDDNENRIWDIKDTPETKIKNAPTGALKLIKTSADGKTVLPGAVFVLKDQKGQVVTTDANGKDLPENYTTNDKGIIEVKNLIPGEYTWEEISAPSGYVIGQKETSAEVTSGKTTETTVKNIELVNLSGTKTWNLAGNSEHLVLPSAIKVVLQQEPKADQDGQVQEVTAANHWQYTFKDLPKYYLNKQNEAIAYRYTVKEEALKGFDAKYDGLNITNTLKTKNISGDKKWDNLLTGTKNLIPQKVLLHLQYRLVGASEDAWQNFTNQKGEAITQTVSADNWHYTFSNLPLFNQEEKELEYRVVDEVKGFEPEFDGINLHNHLQTTEVKVTKNWLDDDNFYQTRPKKLPVTLMVKVDDQWQTFDKAFGLNKEITLTSENNWLGSFKDLPVYDALGNKIIYGVREDNQPTYHANDNEAKVVEVNQATNTADLINTLERTELTVTKNWDDFDNLFNTRPEQITFKLYRVTENGEKQVVSTKVNPSGEYVVQGPEFKAIKISDLPTYDAAGKKVTYLVEETNIAKNYQATPDYQVKDNELTITNVLPTTSISVQKIWDEAGNQEIKRPSVTLQLFKEVAGKKEAVENKNGTKDFTKVIPADSKTNWSYTFSNLPKYDKNGKEIRYYVKELASGNQYTSTAVNDTTIKNVLKTTQLSGEKIWKDGNNSFGLRPENLTFQLLQNGVEMPGKTVKVSAATNWRYTFSNLPKVDEKGTPYHYTVKEVNAPKAYVVTETNKPENRTFDITNTLQLVEIKGKKTWKDQDNAFASRPSQLWIQLYQNGKKMVGYLQVTTAKRNWTYNFGNLPKMDAAGNLYQYSVKEVTPPKNYQQETQNPNALLDLTNTLIETSVTGEKTWEDFNNQFASRPESIKVQLYQNGKEMEGYLQEVTADQNWQYTFQHLPKLDKDGKEYVYTVKEVDTAKNYVATEDGMNVTNTLEETSVTGEKTWEDFDNQFASRPESIKVQLYQNGKEMEGYLQEVTAKQNWQYTFQHLPKLDKDGKEYVYTVKEVDTAKNYVAKEDGMNVTNTLEETSVTGEKTWEDFDNQFASRPESIKVQLYQNGKEMEDYLQEVTAKQNWQYTFQHLPKLDKDGKEYVYTVKEVDTAKNYVATEDGMNVTNTLVTTQVAGEKIWHDQQNKAQLRPTSITVVLLQNGKAFKEVNVTQSTNWHYTFKDLPKFDRTGKAYVYTVKEKVVPKGYVTNVKGNNIINTYTPPVTSKTPETPQTKPGNLPKTGENSHQISVVVGLVMMFLSILILVSVSYKRKN